MSVELILWSHMNSQRHGPMIESFKFHMQPLGCFNLGRKATGLVVSLSEQNPTQWAREHGNLYSSYLNLKKLGVIFLFPMFPGLSLHGWISVLFEVFLGTLMIIDVWVLQRPIAGDVHVLYVRRFQTGVHDFMNDAGGPKALELRYLFNSFNFYIFVFAVKSMTPFGMTWYRQVSCEGWGRVGSTQQMNLRTAANVRPSLAVTVYAIMWPDC